MQFLVCFSDTFEGELKIISYSASALPDPNFEYSKFIKAAKKNEEYKCKLESPVSNLKFFPMAEENKTVILFLAVVTLKECESLPDFNIRILLLLPKD